MQISMESKSAALFSTFENYTREIAALRTAFLRESDVSMCVHAVAQHPCHSITITTRL